MKDYRAESQLAYSRVGYWNNSDECEDVNYPVEEVCPLHISTSTLWNEFPINYFPSKKKHKINIPG